MRKVLGLGVLVIFLAAGMQGVLADPVSSISPDGGTFASSPVEFTITCTDCNKIFYKTISVDPTSPPTADDCNNGQPYTEVKDTNVTDSLTCPPNSNCFYAVCYYSFRQLPLPPLTEDVKVSNVSEINTGGGWAGPDSKPPVTTIEPDGADEKQDVQFTLNCTDEGPNVCDRVYYAVIDYADDCSTAPYTEVSNSGGDDPFYVDGSVTCLPGQLCEKKVCFYGVDNSIFSNQEAVKESQKFTVDKTGATAWITGIEPIFYSEATGRNYTNQTSFTVRWSGTGNIDTYDVIYRVEENGNPVSCPGVLFTDNPPAGTWCKFKSATKDTSGVFGPNLPETTNVPVEDNSTYIFRVRANWGATHWDWSEEFGVTVDTAEPTCVIDGLPATTAPGFTLTWRINDGGSGVKNGTIEYNTLEGHPEGWWYDANNSITLEYFSIFDGSAVSHQPGGLIAFRCRVEDYAGHAGPWSDIVNTTIVTDAPRNVQIEPLKEWINSGTFKIKWSAVGADNYTLQGNGTGVWEDLLTESPLTSYDFRGGVSGTTYCFKVIAKNIVGESESPVECTTVDTEPPAVEVWGYKNRETTPLPDVAGTYTGTLNITSNASDLLSGVENITIEYVQGPYMIPVHCSGDFCCTSQPLNITPETTLQYRATATDRAGNRNESDWKFLTEHPLANFAVKSLVLTLGSMHIAKVQVRNLQDETDNITLTLSGYQYAEFLPGQAGAEVYIAGSRRNGQLKAFYVAPNELREYSVKILSSEPAVYLLNITATSDLPGLTDKDSMSIRTEYPASFPGLTEWAVVLLIMISVGIYFGGLKYEVGT